MDPVTLHAFSDELTKIAGIGDLWQSFLDLFRSKDEKVQRRVDYHFSPRAGTDRWRKLSNNVRDPKFVQQVASHPEADDKLKRHVQSLHDLSRARVVGKIQSSRLPGQTYEIRKLPSGFGCTCPDWKYKGSVTPGYECKHIKAHKRGEVRAP